MSNLHEKIQEALVNTLQDDCGAGSDLRTGNLLQYGSLEVFEGTIDIPHLASDVEMMIVDEKVKLLYALSDEFLPDKRVVDFQSTEEIYFRLRGRANKIHTDHYGRGSNGTTGV